MKKRVKAILAPVILAEIFGGVLYPLIRKCFLPDITFPTFYKWFTSLTLCAKGYIESNGVYPISSVTWYVDILVLNYCLYWLVCHLTKKREKLYLPLCVIVVFFGWVCIKYIDFPLLWYANGRGYAGFFVGVLLCELQHNDRVDHKRVAYAGLIAAAALGLLCRQLGIEEVLGDIRISFLFFVWPCLLLPVLNIPWVKKIMEFPLLHKVSLWSEYIFFSHPIAISTMGLLNKQLAWGLSFYDGRSVLLVLAAVLVVAVLFRIILVPFRRLLSAAKEFFTRKAPE